MFFAYKQEKHNSFQFILRMRARPRSGTRLLYNFNSNWNPFSLNNLIKRKSKNPRIFCGSRDAMHFMNQEAGTFYYSLFCHFIAFNLDVFVKIMRRVYICGSPRKPDTFQSHTYLHFLFLKIKHLSMIIVLKKGSKKQQQHKIKTP